MIAGRIFRFIGVLLFLVQNHKAQIDTGGKHRAAGTHHQLGFAGFHPFPLVVAFSCRETAVEHRNPVPKVSGNRRKELGGQCDLRHQKHGTLACLQAILDQFDINRGFSRAGNAVKQRYSRVFLFPLGIQPHKCSVLFCIQNQRPIQLRRFDLPAAKHRPLRQGQISQLFQPVDRCGRCSRKIAKFLDRNTAQAAEQFQHCLLHGSGFGPMGCKFHGFLRRGCQSCDPFRFVAEPS